MSVLKLSIEHGRTLDDARQRLETVVKETTARFGSLIKQVDWSAARDAVTLSGTGFNVKINVDDREVHVAADLQGFAALLSSPLVSGVKQIIQRTFQKRLT